MKWNNAFSQRPRDIPSLPGVYLILSPNKYYIGSSINLKDRMKTHSSQLKRGRHGNVHLQRVFNKYDSLKFFVLKVFVSGGSASEKDSLIKREEQTLLNQAKGCKRCMNMKFEVNQAPDTQIPIVSFDRFGRKKAFPSSRVAAEKLGMSHYSISNILRKKSKISKGFTFFYENDSIKNWKKSFGLRGRGSKCRVKATNSNGDSFEFESQSEAGRTLNLKVQSIGRVLNGKRKSTGGYKFEGI